MTCPDVNLLLYTVNASLPQHERAKAWWEATLSDSKPVVLLHVVVSGFVRLSTHPRVFPQPLSLDQAIAVVDGWLNQPQVELAGPGPGHWPIFKRMLRATGGGGNLTTDAHIASVASEMGLQIYSNDADFARFEGVQVVNPLREDRD